MKTYDWVRRDVVKAGGAVAAVASWAAPLTKAFGKSKAPPAPAAPIAAVLVDPRYADSRAFADELVARGAKAFSTETDLADLWRGELGALYAKGGVRVAGLTPHSDLFLSAALASEAGARATCSFEGWHDCRGAETLSHALEGGAATKGLAGRLDDAGADWAEALAAQIADAAAARKPTVRDVAATGNRPRGGSSWQSGVVGDRLMGRVFSPSRRSVLVGAAATGLLPAVRAGAAPMALRPVVSFHMDQPFLDMSGRGKPYLPPKRTAPPIPQAVFDHHPYL